MQPDLPSGAGVGRIGGEAGDTGAGQLRPEQTLHGVVGDVRSLKTCGTMVTIISLLSSRALMLDPSWKSITVLQHLGAPSKVWDIAHLANPSMCVIDRA
eukprot:s296_g4.t1